MIARLGLGLLLATIGCAGGGPAGPAAERPALIEPAPAPPSGPGPDDRGVAATPPASEAHPADRDRDAREAAARIATLFDGLAANLAGADGDCGRLAVAIDTWSDQNHAAVVAAGDALERASAAVRAALVKELEARVGASARTVELAVQRCQDDERVRAAAQKLML